MHKQEPNEVIDVRTLEKEAYEQFGKKEKK